MSIRRVFISDLPHLEHRFRLELNDRFIEVRISGNKLGVHIVDLVNRCEVEREGTQGESSFTAAAFDASRAIQACTYGVGKFAVGYRLAIHKDRMKVNEGLSVFPGICLRASVLQRDDDDRLSEIDQQWLVLLVNRLRLREYVHHG